MIALRITFRCHLALSRALGTSSKTIRLPKIQSNCPAKSSLILSKYVAQQQPNIYPVQKRNFASNYEDDVKDLERVYYGTLAPRMRAVKVFSLTTSLAGLAAQPILVEQGMKMGGTGMAVFLCSFAGFFTFVTPFLLHFVTKKYVTEIHYNPTTDEYAATTINIILQKVQTKFRPSDVKVPEVPGMFTSFCVGNKSLFVDPALFVDPEHYVRIMGYDKPIDFKLDLKEATETQHDINKSKK